MYVLIRFQGVLCMHLLWTTCLCSLQIHMLNEVLTLSAMVLEVRPLGSQVDLDEIVEGKAPTMGLVSL